MSKGQNFHSMFSVTYYHQPKDNFHQPFIIVIYLILSGLPEPCVSKVNHHVTISRFQDQADNNHGTMRDFRGKWIVLSLVLNLLIFNEVFTNNYLFVICNDRFVIPTIGTAFIKYSLEILIAKFVSKKLKLKCEMLKLKNSLSDNT